MAISWSRIWVYLTTLTSAIVLYYTITVYTAKWGWFNYEFVNPNNDRELNRLDFGLFHAKQASFKIMRKTGGLKLKNETFVNSYQCNASSPSACDDSDIVVARMYSQIALALAVLNFLLTVSCLRFKSMTYYAQAYVLQIIMEGAYLILVISAVAGVAIFIANSSGFAQFDPTQLEYGDQFKGLFICQALGGVVLALRVVFGIVWVLWSCCGGRGKSITKQKENNTTETALRGDNGTTEEEDDKTKKSN